MPIRIPNLGPSSSGPVPQGVSISDAVKPALALSNVAQGIGKVGDKLYEHDLKIMEAENAADLTEFKTMAKTAYANRQASFADDHDHLTYKDKWDKDLEGLRKTLSEKGYSQSALEKANLWLAGFEGDSRIGVGSAVQRKAVERRDQNFKNGVAQIEKFYDPGNPQVGQAMFGELLDDQNLTPEAREAAQMQFDDFAKRKKIFTDIQEDPKGWLERNDKPKGDIDQWQKNVNRAKITLGSVVREEGKTALDAIYSKTGVTDEDIAALTPTMRPSERARIIDQRDRLNDARTRRTIESEPYQAALVGEVADLLETYHPDGTYEDDPLLVIQSKLREMKPGLERDRLQARLKDINQRVETGWKEQAEQIKTVTDWSLKQLDEDFSARKKKLTTKSEQKGRSLASLLDDGFLGDEDRLKRFGYTEDQAEEIAEAWKDQKEEAIDGDKHDGPDPLDLVRLYWSEGGAADADFPQSERAVFQAIRDNKGRTHSIADPVASAQAGVEREKKLQEERARYGAARMQLSQILAADPKMSMQQAAKVVEDLGYDVEAGDTGLEWEGDRPETREDRAEPLPPLKGAGAFKVFTGSRDEISGFSSSEGSRKIALDFNDAKNKSARGIEIVLPRSHSSEEKQLAQEWARQTQSFFKSKGVVVPIRQGGSGVKIGGGKAGVIHTEPFFASNAKARQAIMSDPEGYARVLGSTLGRIKGVTFMAPHTRMGAKDDNPGPGASSGEFSERSFAMKVILPALLKNQNG